MTAETKATYRANREFLTIVLKSTVIAAAMKVLSIQEKSEPSTSKHPLPSTTATKSQKHDYLIGVSTAIVDEFIFQQSHVDQGVKSVLLEQEREDIVNNQQRTEDGRFPCRFQGYTKSFAFDGKSRNRHKQTHDPPPTIPEQAVLSSRRPRKQATKPIQDDIFNHNCALLQDGFLFLNILDAVSEEDGPRVMRHYKFIIISCKTVG